MPVNLASKSLTGEDCAMSSALPCGTPSTMSNRTTSPSCLRPMRWASVPPIWPAPIKAIFLRAMWGKLSILKRRGARRSRWLYGSAALRQGTGGNRLYTLYQHWPRPKSRPFGQPLQVSTMPPLSPLSAAAPRAVRQREIGLRAHLDQARGRALEFLRLVAVGRPGRARPARLRPTRSASRRGRRACRSG